MDKLEHIAVSIATFNRPQGLKAVLDGIEAQNVTTDISLRVIIVDNSPDGNARAYVNARADTYRWPLTYHSETRPGITYPRNRGVDDALEGGDEYIVFTDDDVLVDPDWINELYLVAMETGAAAVSGAVKARFMEKPPRWIEKGGFFEVTDLPDGQSVNYGHTTSSLVLLDHIRKLKLRFDPFFSLTGGEDTEFFQALRGAGGETVFSRKAVVHECIGPERLNLAWLLKRWFRTGNTEGLIMLRDGRGIFPSVGVGSKGVLRTSLGATGAFLTLPTLLIGRVDTFKYLRVMSRGMGFIASVFGITYEEYRNHNR